MLFKSGFVFLTASLPAKAYGSCHAFITAYAEPTRGVQSLAAPLRKRGIEKLSRKRGRVTELPKCRCTWFFHPLCIAGWHSTAGFCLPLTSFDGGMTAAGRTRVPFEKCG